MACHDRQACVKVCGTLSRGVLLTLLLAVDPSKYLGLFVFQVLRSGEELEYEVVMQPLQTLVPVHKYDQLPSYFIYAGMYVCKCITFLNVLYMCVMPWVYLCLSVCVCVSQYPCLSRKPPASVLEEVSDVEESYWNCGSGQRPPWSIPLPTFSASVLLTLVASPVLCRARVCAAEPAVPA